MERANQQQLPLVHQSVYVSQITADSCPTQTKYIITLSIISARVNIVNHVKFDVSRTTKSKRVISILESSCSMAYNLYTVYWSAYLSRNRLYILTLVRFKLAYMSVSGNQLIFGPYNAPSLCNATHRETLVKLKLRPKRLDNQRDVTYPESYHSPATTKNITMATICWPIKKCPSLNRIIYRELTHTTSISSQITLRNPQDKTYPLLIRTHSHLRHTNSSLAMSPVSLNAKLPQECNYNRPQNMRCFPRQQLVAQVHNR